MYSSPADNKSGSIKLFVLVSIFSVLIVIVIYFNYENLYSLKFSNYYLIGSKLDLLLNSKNSCHPIVENPEQYFVNISNRIYPTHLNLHLNKSIDFSCLNKKENIKVILLWNKFFGIADYYYGLGSEYPFFKHNCPGKTHDKPYLILFL